MYKINIIYTTILLKYFPKSVPTPLQTDNYGTGRPWKDGRSLLIFTCWLDSKGYDCKDTRNRSKQ